MIIIDHVILMKSRAEKSLPEQALVVFISAFQSSFKGITSLKLVTWADRPCECSPDNRWDCCR